MSFIVVAEKLDITHTERLELTPGYVLRRAKLHEALTISNHILNFAGDMATYYTRYFEYKIPPGGGVPERLPAE